MWLLARHIKHQFILSPSSTFPQGSISLALTNLLAMSWASQCRAWCLLPVKNRMLKWVDNLGHSDSPCSPVAYSRRMACAELSIASRGETVDSTFRDLVSSSRVEGPSALRMAKKQLQRTVYTKCMPTLNSMAKYTRDKFKR